MIISFPKERLSALYSKASKILVNPPAAFAKGNENNLYSLNYEIYSTLYSLDLLK